MAETVAKRANPLAPLTDPEIRALAPPAEGRLALRDPACRGLELRRAAPSSRNPAGTRTWSLEVKVAGRQRRFTIGRYPEVGLAEARRRAGRLRADALDGRDPVEEGREARRAARLRRAGAADTTTVRVLLDSFERLAARPRGLRSWPAMRGMVEANFGALLDKAPDDGVRSAITRLAVEAPMSDAEPDERYAGAVLARVQELAATRRTTELKQRLQRVNPVEAAEEYNRMCGVLFSLEQTVRALRERGFGSL